LNDWEKLSKRLRIVNWGLLLILVAASSLSMFPAFTAGLAAGGLLSIANFSALGRSVVSAFGIYGADKAGKVSIIFKFYMRLALVGILIFILVGTSLVNPIGLAIGLSIVVINIIVLGIVRACNFSSREAI